MTHRRDPIRPDRLRILERPFAWLPCRMLHNGTLTNMTPDERQLYLALALAADRDGMSFYPDQRLARILRWSPSDLLEARQALIDHALLAYDGPTYQLLALPSGHTPPSGVSAQPALSKPGKVTTAPDHRAPVAKLGTDESNEPYQSPMPAHIRNLLSHLLDVRAK